MSFALQTASQGASEGLRAGEFAVMTLIESVGGPWVQMMGIGIQTCPVARRRNANCGFEAPVKDMAQGTLQQESLVQRPK